MHFSGSRRLILTFSLLFILFIPIIRTQNSYLTENTSTQQIKVQQQNDWLILQEINNSAQNSYFTRNATYYLPVTSKELTSSINLEISLRDWYFTNTKQVVAFSQLVAPDGTVTQQKSASSSDTSIIFNVVPNQKGIWKLIIFLDFSKIIPINSSNPAEGNVDVQVTVTNLQAAVSYEENEYDSWLPLPRKLLFLRIIEFTYDAYIDVNNSGDYSFIAQFFNNNNTATINEVNFTSPQNKNFSINYNSVSSITNPIKQKLQFNTTDFGIWKFEILFNGYFYTSSQAIQLLNPLNEPVKIYMVPISGSGLFIDNNFNGINDLNSTAENLAVTQSNTNIVTYSLTNSLSITINPVLLSLVTIGLVLARKKLK